MMHTFRCQVLQWLSGSLLSIGTASLASRSQSERTPGCLPLPVVQPADFPTAPIPGAMQPRAPGERAAPQLPQFQLLGMLECPPECGRS